MSYKVAVIDDNMMIRESIIKTIEWRELDCIVIGQAGDGIEGKRVITENNPDIIITDIRMPGLDGLELAKFVKPLMPATKVILITGYTDFENAQAAVKLNIFDFILKPIKNEELFNIVKAAVKEIKEEKNKNELLKSKLLADIFTGNHHGEKDILSKVSMLGLEANRYLTFIIRVRKDSVSDTCDYPVSVSSMVNKLKVNHGLDIREVYIHRDVVCTVLFEKVISVREAKLKVRRFCMDLHGKIMSETGFKCCFAVSSLYKSLTEIYYSYKEAFETISINFFQPDKELFFADEWYNKNSPEKFSIIHELEDFFENFEKLSNADITEHINVLIEKIKLYGNGDIFSTKVLLSQICITTSRYYFIRTGDNGTDYYKNFQETLVDINKLEDINLASQYIKGYIIHVRDLLKSKATKFSPLISKVIEYINSSYTENITLDSVANLFSLSPGYLCRLLKKETGENFVGIVSKTRISAAKKLLKDPNNKVYEVALKVGYDNYAYFYQVFKRVEGVNPKEYCRAGHLPVLN